jgi:hypothetical protein
MISYEFGDRVEFDLEGTVRFGSIYGAERSGWIIVLSNDEAPGQFYTVHPDAVRKI